MTRLDTNETKWMGTITSSEGATIGAKTPTPLGERHLHLVCLSGKWIWAVRERTGAICKTDRCRLVTIKEQAS